MEGGSIAIIRIINLKLEDVARALTTGHSTLAQNLLAMTDFGQTQQC